MNDIEMIVENEKKMVTQKCESDDFYENLTIYPVIESRKTGETTDIYEQQEKEVYQLLKVKDQNIDNREANLDLLCFPDIFCGGRNGQNQDRKSKLQPADFAKCVLQSKDSRFRLNSQYLFYLLNQANMRQISAGIYHKLNITNATAGLTKNTFLDSTEESDAVMNTNLSNLHMHLNERCEGTHTHTHTGRKFKNFLSAKEI